MATLEQKEALIEAVAQVSALIFRKTGEIDLNEDSRYLSKQRNFLYSNLPEDIDFDEIIKNLQAIMNRYNSLPDKE